MHCERLLTFLDVSDYSHRLLFKYITFNDLSNLNSIFFVKICSNSCKIHKFVLVYLQYILR